MQTTTITPRRRWLDVDVKGLWRYRDLYIMYIKRDIVTQYKQTILGPLWYVIQPLLTTIMYMFVFGGLAGISTDGVPQPLFYMAGILMWNYFQECFKSSSEVFSANAAVFGKVYFPRLVVPLSACTSNLIRMFIQFGMFILIYIYYVATDQFSFLSESSSSLSSLLSSSSSFSSSFSSLSSFSSSFSSSSSFSFLSSSSFSLLLIPVLILMTGLHALSWGLLFSSWTVKYRDLRFLIQFGIQLAMYATPVIYPLSYAPEQYRWIINLNPLTPIFEAFKYATLGVGTFDIYGILYSLGILFLTLFLSVLIFSRTEQRFMDTV